MLIRTIYDYEEIKLKIVDKIVFKYLLKEVCIGYFFNKNVVLELFFFIDVSLFSYLFVYYFHNVLRKGLRRQEFEPESENSSLHWKY